MFQADLILNGWKNEFLTVIGEVYSNALFCGTPYVPIPAFPKFRRNSKKKDIFTTEELNIFFKERLWLEHSETKYQNFPQFDEGHKAMYFLSLCCVKLGLRVVPLPDDLAAIMKNYIRDMNLGPEDFVFQRYENEFLHLTLYATHTLLPCVEMLQEKPFRKLQNEFYENLYFRKIIFIFLI